MFRIFSSVSGFYRVRCYSSLVSLECGLDESGRGAVLGPLVIGAVIVNEEQKKFLQVCHVYKREVITEFI